MRSRARRKTPAKAISPLKDRRLTVINAWRGTGNVPHIVLLGRWLADAGFLPGCRLSVRVRRQRLLLQVVEPPDPNWRRETDD